MNVIATLKNKEDIVTVLSTKNNFAMLVSVILCTYNRATLLPRAIKSVLRQTHTMLELIIVDDGSSDGTKQLVNRCCNMDSRISYIFQPNAGLAAARNAGIRIAIGDFFCFVDSDDELAPTHIEKRMNYLERNRKVDFLHGGMKLIGPKEKQYVVDLTNLKKKIHLSKCCVGGTFFFRRKILWRVRKFRAIPFGEDFDFYRRVEKYFTVRKVSFPTYVYHLDVDNRLCDVYTEKLLKRKD